MQPVCGSCLRTAGCRIKHAWTRLGKCHRWVPVQLPRQHNQAAGAALQPTILHREPADRAYQGDCSATVACCCMQDAAQPRGCGACMQGPMSLAAAWLPGCGSDLCCRYCTTKAVKPVGEHTWRPRCCVIEPAPALQDRGSTRRLIELLSYRHSPHTTEDAPMRRHTRPGQRLPPHTHIPPVHLTWGFSADTQSQPAVRQQQHDDKPPAAVDTDNPHICRHRSVQRNLLAHATRTCILWVQVLCQHMPPTRGLRHLAVPL